MAELVTRGPIACTVAVTKEFEAYTSGIFQDKTGAKVRVCTYSKLLPLIASCGVQAVSVAT